MASQTSNYNTVIYYNDFIDSDNMAAALALLLAAKNDPNTQVLWILEPRQVSLGLGMSGLDIAACKELIEKHFPEHGKPLKVLLGGLLTIDDIESIKGLSEKERDLLSMAIKPEYGPKDDAILHARLMAWELASYLTQRSGPPVEVFIDLHSLSEIENPVNLNLHHHEELMSRTEDELREHEKIMGLEGEERNERLRTWYEGCIGRAKKAGAQGNVVTPLDLDALCKTIRGSAKVQFLGGSSLGILKKFIEEGVANNVQCHLQVGSCDLTTNLFPNQFNIALNRTAAKFVFDNFTKFLEFIVVPSHSAQNIKYSSLGLEHEGGKSLGKRILGFNFHEDALEIATGGVTLRDEHAKKAVAMPDLTSFLCALKPGYMGSSRGYVQVDVDQGVLIFRPDTEGIPMCDLRAGRTLETPEEMKQIWGSLRIPW